MFREKQKDVPWTVESLRQFEQTIADRFEAGKIHGPVHLSYGNEDYLIDLFQYIRPDDWVFSTWRNHYHALLHGIPEETLMAKVMEGKSLSFQCPEHHFFTSAIVNGIIPIAVGNAIGIKWRGTPEMVWCFVGDMAAESGEFYTAVKFSIRNNLPIHFVIEDNGLSTASPTQETWGMENVDAVKLHIREDLKERYVSYFKYTRGKYPHVGIGKWIHF